ncbi:hypothetical protein JKP88DRAFT_137106, partial [Tribonema minus]
CTIGRHNSYGLNHIAHLAQSLFPCWSLFLQNMGRERVVLLLDGLSVSDAWGIALLEAMGARLVTAPTDLCGPGHGLVAFPGNGKMWFDGADDANLLRDEVLRRAPNGTVVAEECDEQGCPLRVGILDRAPGVGRHLYYVEAMRAAILQRPREQRAAQLTTVDMAVFDGWSLAQQAAWAARHDVIISPHGNQLTNVAFARRCAVVLELFPPNYIVPDFFTSLALDAGAVSFYLHVLPSQNESTRRGRARERSKQLYYTAEHIMRVWDDMLAARDKCL